MAKMITRTVIGTQLTAKVVNKETEEIYTKSLILDTKVEDVAKAVKLASKLVAENEVVISVSDLATVEKLYGVTVEDFMSVAVELDPVTRKPLAKVAPTDEQ